MDRFPRRDAPAPALSCRNWKNWRKIAGFPLLDKGFSMVVIRLARGGAKKRPFYDLVVADKERACTGRFIERVGFYDPCAPEGRESLRIAMDRVTYWQGKGAKLSDTAARLVKQFGTAQAA